MPHPDVVNDVVKKPTTFSPVAVVGIVVAVVSVLALLAWINQPRPSTTASPLVVSTPAEPLEVRYEVTGEGTTTASLTVATPTGTSQMDADLPLRNKSGSKGLIFTGFSSGAFLYISAQNSDQYGTVTCRIKVGDVVVSENTASGGYQIATCQAQA